MKYWAYLIAKLVVAAGLVYGFGWLINRLLPPQKAFLDGGKFPAHYDLLVNIALMLLALFAIGITWLIIWDQRYRCRTCLRRLRMPLTAGSWPNMLLIGQPRTEYICIYGHGTLIVPEVQLTGGASSDWEPHEDMWTELESIEAGKK